MRESVLEICKKTFKFNFIHLIEKPVGINYEESVYILDLAKKYKTKVFVSEDFIPQQLSLKTS